MDYKSTLNLPQTEFPMQANLVQREPERLARWIESDLYGRIQKSRADRPVFILHDGPPFANGDVHIGTAFNKILKDMVVKYHSLRGQRAPYVPGWDCHGLPIESKVTQELRASGNTAADAATIRSACDAYARKYIDLQRQQFKRLGVLGDWDRPYQTLDRSYEAEELRLFANLVEKGFVYRGKKPVYWSIPFRTALAEAEVEYKDHISQSVYVRFRVKGEPNTFVLIWTTTPWTLPANLAVAFNPTFHYSQVITEGGVYIVANALLSQISEKLGWGAYQIIRTVHSEELASLEYEHPFCARTGRLYPAEFVDNTTGTGFVHIAPGHGLEDYHLGLSVGLPVYCPVDDEGRLAHTTDLPTDQQMPAGLLGLSVLTKGHDNPANAAVIALLEEKQALAFRESYTHSYPHCWRSKTPVVFRAVDQWFIRIDHPASQQNASVAATFRQTALQSIQGIRWIPDWGINRIQGAVETRPDWCISRQRTWGVPIPAFYAANGDPILDAEIVRNAARLIESHGSNVWFEKSTPELWTLCRPQNWAGPEATTKSSDTLDVWIDSGSSSRAVLMNRPELSRTANQIAEDPAPWRADMYLEGSDQHRGWFQSSLLLSLAGNGAPPFKTVLTHGFMVKASKLDPKQKEKVSKSATYEKPETADRYVNQYGADVVRLWVASQDFRGDVWVGDDRIQKVSETYRLIRNTLRYQLSNLYDFDPTQHAVPRDQLSALDRWILNEFAALEKSVDEAYRAYEFHTVYQKLSQFISVELSAVYHDVVKDRLYTDAAASPRRRSTQTALHTMLTRLCLMLSPILSFTTDEAWEYLAQRSTPSVHLAEWTPDAPVLSDADADVWKTLFQLRDQALGVLEKSRQAKTIGKALEARVELDLPEPAATAVRANTAELRELLNVSQLHIQTAPELAVRVAHATGAKCDRCWHWELEVGQNPTHPNLCPRCVSAVQPRLS